MPSKLVKKTKQRWSKQTLSQSEKPQKNKESAPGIIKQAFFFLCISFLFIVEETIQNWDTLEYFDELSFNSTDIYFAELAYNTT